MRKHEGDLTIRPRDTESVVIRIPVDTMESLRRAADARDMSPEALIRFYVGQGLRADLARMFSDRVFGKTAEVLSRHIDSEDEVAAIVEEIRQAAAG